MFAFKSKKCGGVILTFYKFKGSCASAISSKEFILIRLSYMSLANVLMMSVPHLD